MKQMSNRNDGAAPQDPAARAAEPLAAELKPSALGAALVRLLPGTVPGIPRFGARFIEGDELLPDRLGSTYGDEDEFAEEEEEVEDEEDFEEEEDDDFDEEEDEDDEEEDEEDEEGDEFEDEEEDGDEDDGFEEEEEDFEDDD